MRWISKLDKIGDRRIKQSYLFFPKRIDDNVRWLEWATWEDRYYGWRAGWAPIKWLENREEI